MRQDISEKEEITQTILLAQYQAALDLYKHEDSLNWSKFNNLLYITAGIGALLSYVLKNKEQIIVKDTNPLLFVSLLGLIASIGFSIAIFFGVKYMLKRKKKVVEIDHLLKENGGGLLLDIDRQEWKKSDYQQFSPTMWVLILSPVIIGCLWLYLLLSVFISTMWVLILLPIIIGCLWLYLLISALKE